MGKFGIEFNKILHAFRYLILGKNCFCWTFWFAERAVDAFIGIDDQEIGSFMKTIDGTDINTISKFAFDTVFCDYKGHNYYQADFVIE